ncbi:AraC family transcriptional regulator [Ancylobacter terrae]|uniref:AraC family transcriptional regulator n=1 Tax=Ancylobacter sp. sgz301288 TaxID=3342077 RepID=UPI00385966C0
MSLIVGPRSGVIRNVALGSLPAPPPKSHGVPQLWPRAGKGAAENTMWDRHPVKLSLIHMLPEFAERYGFGMAPLLASAGLDEHFEADRFVARAQVSTLLHAVARRAQEPTLGLDLAAAADPLRLGLTGRALLGGRTLREGLAAHALQMPTLQGGVRVALEEAGGIAHWRHSFLDSDAHHAAVLNEGVAAFVVAALRAVTGGEEAAAPVRLHVDLPHRARASTTLYEDKLDAGVSFGNGVGVIVSFDAGWLDRPNRLAGAVASAPMAVPQSPGTRDWLDDAAVIASLERLFSGSALAGDLSLSGACRTLGLAPRSLQRRLAALGTSFEMLVDGWRRTEARRHLADPALPVGSVARLLGYRDPAHFIRAFRRWEGDAPSAFRRAHVARNGN